MLSQLAHTRRGSQAGRLIAVAAVALLLVVSVSAGGALVAGLGVVDADDAHGGIASAQSENETDSRTSGVGDTSTNESGADDGSSGGPVAEGEVTPMDERADSQVQDSPDEAANESAAAENETATDRRADSQVPTNGPSNASTGDDFRGGDGDDDDSGVGFVAQQVINMIDGLRTQMSNEFGELVAQMFEQATTRSAPGVADDPSTWASPEAPEWQGSVDVTELTRFMGGGIVLIAAVYSILEFFKQPRSAKRRMKYCLFAFIYLLKPTFWNGLTLHFSNTISSTILPGGEAFATPEGVLLVGLTVIVGGLLASASLLVIALAAFVTVIAHSAGLLTSAFLPLAIAFYCMNMYMRSLGEMVVYLHGVTIFMPIFQSLAVLAISRMALGSSGFLGSLSGVLMFLGMIYLVFYLFQKEVLEKAFDAPITSLGVHGAQMSASGAMNAKSTVQNAPEMFKNMKAGIEANIEGAKSRFTGSDGFSRPDIGVFQSQGASRQSAAAVADGGSDGYSRTPDAKSWGSRPVGRDDQGRFQSIDDIAENRERDRLSHGDY